MSRALTAALVVCLSSAALAQVPEPVISSPETAPSAETVISEAEVLEQAKAPLPLDIYGFANLLYYKPLGSRSNPWLQHFPRESSFIMGNVNLYLAADLGDRVRSMVEVRFLYAPQSDQVLKEDGEYVRQRTDVNDPSEYGRRLKWGGILLERAWVEYDVSSWLTARAGQFLTPYGIWNVDHGAPTLVGIQRPWVIREGLFPEWQTGVELHGRWAVGDVSLGYHLTVSNGRGPYDSVLDTDDNKGLGARAVLEARAVGRLTLGASAYRGRYTEYQERWDPTSTPDVYQLNRRTLVQYDELSLAADLRWEWQSLLVNSELVLNDRAYREGGRPKALGTMARFAPDLRRWGSYVQVGYRTRWQLMPYASVELFNMGPGAYPTTLGHNPHALTYNAGLNFRPRPTLVLKAEAYASTFPSAGAGSWGANSNYQGFQAQVAWVF